MREFYTKVSKTQIILLLIILVGLFLRIYALSSDSLWNDEIGSIKISKLELFQIAGRYDVETNPRIYYIILHYWINLFGDSEFSVRFPSAIFGLFAILMMYKVGTLIFDREVGVLSSLILALSTFHITYSQEARMYSLMVLLTLLSIYFFIKLLKKEAYCLQLAIFYLVFF